MKLSVDKKEEKNKKIQVKFIQQNRLRLNKAITSRPSKDIWTQNEKVYNAIKFMQNQDSIFHYDDKDEKAILKQLRKKIDLENYKANLLL